MRSLGLRDLGFCGPLRPYSVVDDWVRRIRAAGGTIPSAGTIDAVTTFYNALVSASIHTKMKACCCFVPDSLIAAITPLIQGVGYASWTNNNFVSGDLTVNGLIGNGSTKWLDTGIKPADIFTKSNAGMSVYLANTDGSLPREIGCLDASYTPALILHVNLSGTSFFTVDGNDTQISGADAVGTGLYSGNRVVSSMSLYVRSSARSSTLATTSSSATANGWANVDIAEFGALTSGGITGQTTRRHSFSALHEGLSSAEVTSLYNAVQAMRTSLGGGYV